MNTKTHIYNKKQSKTLNGTKEQTRPRSLSPRQLDDVIVRLTINLYFTQ